MHPQRGKSQYAAEIRIQVSTTIKCDYDVIVMGALMTNDMKNFLLTLNELLHVCAFIW